MISATSGRPDEGTQDDRLKATCRARPCRRCADERRRPRPKPTRGARGHEGRRQHDPLAEGEVDHARGLVDDDERERDQRVDAPASAPSTRARRRSSTPRYETGPRRRRQTSWCRRLGPHGRTQEFPVIPRICAVARIVPLSGACDDEEGSISPRPRSRGLARNARPGGRPRERRGRGGTIRYGPSYTGSEFFRCRVARRLGHRLVDDHQAIGADTQPRLVRHARVHALRAR